MSRLFLVSLSLPLLAHVLPAQTNPEGIQIYPGSGGIPGNGTSLADRLTFGSAAGEALAHYPKSHFEGIGDQSVAGATNNPTCGLSYVVLYFQDQNQQTQETFGIVMRPAKSTGGPDTTKTVFSFSGIQAPTATGTGPSGWVMWLQFLNNGVPTPITIPCKGDLYFGMSLNANSKWPTSDGLSVWSAYYDPVSLNVTTGDAVAPRTGVPNLTWEINASGTASQPMIPRVLDYILVSPYSMIQVGARHKSGQSNHGSSDGFGAAGLYPSMSGGTNGRQDGAVLRITDNPPGTTPTYGGQYLLYLSLSTGTQFTIPPVQLGGLFGSVYLGPVGQLPLGGGTLSAAGPQTVVLLAPPGTIPPTAAVQGIKVFFQAATTRQGSSVISITNLAGVYY